MVKIKIVSIVLKFLQICPLVAGMGIIAYFLKEYHDFAKEYSPRIDPYDDGMLGRYEFFLFSVCVGIGIAALGLICAFSGLMEKKYGALSMAALQALWVLHLLVATSLLAKVLSVNEKLVRAHGFYGRSTSICKQWDESESYKKYDFNCGQLYGAVVCGFIATGLFAMDTIMSMVAFTWAQL